MTKSKIKKRMYSFLAVVAAFLVVVLMLILSTIKSINNLNSKINDQRLNFETIYYQTNDLKNVTKMEALMTDIEKINSLYVKESDELKFITKLEEIASKYSVSQKIDLMPLQETVGSFKVMSAKISLNGNFRNILRYIEALEKLNYNLNISRINITNLFFKKERPASESANISASNVEAGIDGKIFIKPAETPKAS